MKSIRFTFLCSSEEMEKLEALALFSHRTKSGTIRLLIREASNSDGFKKKIIAKNKLISPEVISGEDPGPHSLKETMNARTKVTIRIDFTSSRLR